MLERLSSDSLFYQLASEAELGAIVQSGEKLSNAYIYAVAADDIDAELFNLERLTQQQFDINSPTIKFEHCSDLTHQNHLTRKSTQIQPKQPPPVAVAAKKEPAIKQEIKKNEPVKPVKKAPEPVKEEKKQQTLVTVPKPQPASVVPEEVKMAEPT